MAIEINGAGTITGLNADGISAQPVFPGQVLQVVRATDSTLRSTTSTSAVDAGISVTITPRSASSAIILIHTCILNSSRSSSGDVSGSIRITDSSNNVISGAERWENRLLSGTILRTPSTAIGYVIANTTNALTFKVQFFTINNVTVELRNDISPGQLFAIEVAA